MEAEPSRTASPSSQDDGIVNGHRQVLLSPSAASSLLTVDGLRENGAILRGAPSRATTMDAVCVIE
jgi:hypothetical protein